MAEVDPALVEKAAEAMCSQLHPKLDLVPMPEHPNPRIRTAACFACQDAARAVLDKVTPATREAALLEAAERVRRIDYVAELEHGGNGDWMRDEVLGVLRDMAAQQREEQDRG